MACLSTALLILFYITYLCECPSFRVLSGCYYNRSSTDGNHLDDGAREARHTLYDEPCGALMIAMSSRPGYLDIEPHNYPRLENR